MTLPPERISVKRRRDEDPVEALYIQSKKYRPSAVWTLQGVNDASKLASQPTESPLKNSATLSTDLSAANAPTLSTLSHATDAVPGRSDGLLPLHGSQEWSAGHQDIPSLVAPRPRVTKPTGACEKGGIIHTTELRLRRFHLSHDSFPSPERRASFTCGIRKHRKPQKDSLALFVETDKRDRICKHSIRAHGLQRGDAVKAQGDHVKTEPDHTDTLVRKRPNAGAAEKAWRAETWGTHKGTAAKDKYETANPSPTNWDPASILLAEELYQFAMEESKAQAQHLHNSPNPRLKFKPKPPKSRETKVETDVKSRNTDAVIRGDIEEDGDYIVDTYIRSSLQPLGIDPSRQAYTDPLQTLDNSKIGILVIEEEQEALWETFAYEQSSEPEIESDEQDENAEDFHGNDYPEDEIDVEDEYGRSSYNFRIDESDDNEYDDHEPEWSDGESPFP